MPLPSTVFQMAPQRLRVRFEGRGRKREGRDMKDHERDQLRSGWLLSTVEHEVEPTVPGS
jgi:hypothetical protein